MPDRIRARWTMFRVNQVEPRSESSVTTAIILSFVRTTEVSPRDHQVEPSDVRCRVQVAVGTLWNWEQGRRNPTGPAKALLRPIEADPANVLRAWRVAA